MCRCLGAALDVDGPASGVFRDQVSSSDFSLFFKGFSTSSPHKWPTLPSPFLQGSKGFNMSTKTSPLSVYQGFRTISRVFSIINSVFNIFSKVVASRSILVGTGTLSTGYKVLQDTNPLCKGSRHCRWDLVASMTSRGAPASPCWHQWQFHQQSNHKP